MPRSIYDPTGDDMIQEGDTFTRPTGQNLSHMPPSAVDGKVGDDPEVKVPLESDSDPGLNADDTARLADAGREALERENDPEARREDEPRQAGMESPGDREDDISGIEDI